MYYLILFTWIVIFLINFLCVINIKYNSMQFVDGFLIGLFYYISIPMVFISFFGEIDTIFLMDPFKPHEHLDVTLNMILGSSIIMFIWFVIGCRNNKVKYDYDGKINWYLYFILFYFIFSIGSFFLSGKADGGHWAHTTHQALKESTLFVFLLNFTNIFRTCTFGVLIFLVEKKKFSKRNALLLGLMIVVVDLFTSFNRITGIYFLIMALIIYRDYRKTIAISTILFFPIIFFISSAWPAFRGLALVDGYNLNSFKSAYQLVVDNFSRNFSASLNDFLFPIFESANIVAYKYIIDHVGNNNFDFLWGQTFILRSFLFFLPTTIWPDKPPVFAIILGDHMQGGDIAINSTFFGEIYANFYFFWPIFLILTILMLNYFFSRISKYFAPAGFCGAFVAFAMWRFDATFMGISIFVILIFILFKNSIFTIYKRRN